MQFALKRFFISVVETIFIVLYDKKRGTFIFHIF